MLRHYIKMAMRHLLKNKIQNLISIVGLSVESRIRKVNVEHIFSRGRHYFNNKPGY